MINCVLEFKGSRRSVTTSKCPKEQEESDGYCNNEKHYSDYDTPDPLYKDCGWYSM